MQAVTLAGTGIRTSRIGFGCNALTTFPHERDALRMLELAFDLGVTHFDVARAYGAGLAEAVLGRFLRGKRDRVTITSKFGLAPPAMPALAGRGAVSFVKRALKHVPAIDRLVRKRLAQATPAGAYGPDACVASLATSRRELGVDMIDIFLLHEPFVADGRNEATIAVLEARRAAGEIRATGIGSSTKRIGPDLTLWPEQYRVVQTENAASRRSLDSVANLQSRALITHGAMSECATLGKKAQAHPALLRSACDATGADLERPGNFASWLLSYALASNADGVVLLRTTNEAHLRENLRHAAVVPSSEKIAAFATFCARLGEETAP